VYAHCARQLLERRDGTPHPIAAAMYLAFGDPREVEGRISGKREMATDAAEMRAGAFAAVVEQIEAGHFPPRPERATECGTCRYAGVCRKEYAQEDDGAAESV
jgi:hypothetical protein